MAGKNKFCPYHCMIVPLGFLSAGIATYISRYIAIMLDTGLKMLYLCIVFRKDTVKEQLI